MELPPLSAGEWLGQAHSLVRVDRWFSINVFVEQAFQRPSNCGRDVSPEAGFALVAWREPVSLSAGAGLDQAEWSLSGGGGGVNEKRPGRGSRPFEYAPHTTRHVALALTLAHSDIMHLCGGFKNEEWWRAR